MSYAVLVLIVAGLYPFFRAWQANRRTSLAHAVLWAAVAWLAWGLALGVGDPLRIGLDPWRYVALCLSGAAGVAVLGARRPHVGAWDFVVLGLVAVMLLPLGEHLVLGSPSLDWLRLLFLGATLVVAVLNYVPTAAWLTALVVGFICAVAYMLQSGFWPPMVPDSFDRAAYVILLVPWLGLWSFRRSSAAKDMDSVDRFNRLWRDFRDRYGLFWGQRVRDQFNRSADNAGLPAQLFWRGWHGATAAPTAAHWQEMHAVLRGLVQRFM